MSTFHSSAPLRSDVTLIEVDDEAVGLAVRDGAGFRFFAAVASVGRLDNQLFASLKALRRSAAEHAAPLAARRRAAMRPGAFGAAA